MSRLEALLQAEPRLAPKSVTHGVLRGRGTTVELRNRFPTLRGLLPCKLQADSVLRFPHFLDWPRFLAWLSMFAESVSIDPWVRPVGQGVLQSAPSYRTKHRSMPE